MSTTKTCAVAVAAAMLSAGGALFQVGAASEGLQALASDQREMFALAMRAEEAQLRAKLSERDLALRQEPFRVERASALPEVEEEVNGPHGPNPPGSRARGRALMAAYPEIHELVVQGKRAFFAARYHQLYQELGLDDSQIEKFELIMISGISHTIGSQPGGIGTVTFDAAPKLQEGEKDKQLRELLGESGFVRLKEHQQSQTTRAGELASMLYLTETPLSTAQGRRFAKLLGETSRRLNWDETQPREYWASVRAEAAKFMTPSQIDAMYGLQARDEFNWLERQRRKAATHRSK